nr:integrase [Pseudomonas aeruginosa]
MESLSDGNSRPPLPVGRKTDWPTNEKTFRTKRDAEDWARRAEDEMVRGVYIQHCGSERM